MRARKTSPALMCISEASRSTAALMMFSMRQYPTSTLTKFLRRRPAR
jgi:hypothetical protein